jgi:hypothetical protein
VSHEPRHIVFLERIGRIKHYGIGQHGAPPAEDLAAATRRVAREAIPDGAYGFTIAHQGTSIGMGLCYWWANDNEIHSRVFTSPGDDLGALAPADSTAMACVWELEVIDFERTAWLEDVLKRGDTERYLGRQMDPVDL